MGGNKSPAVEDWAWRCSPAAWEMKTALWLGDWGWIIVLTLDYDTSLLQSSKGCGLCVHPRSVNLSCWLCLRIIMALFGYRLSGDRQKLFFFFLVDLFFGIFLFILWILVQVGGIFLIFFHYKVNTITVIYPLQFLLWLCFETITCF